MTRQAWQLNSFSRVIFRNVGWFFFFNFIYFSGFQKHDTQGFELNIEEEDLPKPEVRFVWRSFCTKSFFFNPQAKY